MVYRLAKQGDRDCAEIVRDVGQYVGLAAANLVNLFAPDSLVLCGSIDTADELIRQLVRAEPAGRPIVVISSDREVADGVRRHGAYPMGADSLLRRLTRS